MKEVIIKVSYTEGKSKEDIIGEAIAKASFVHSSLADMGNIFVVNITNGLMVIKGTLK